MGKKVKVRHGTWKSSDGLKIHYTQGEGNQRQTIILLHGLGGDETAWRKTQEELAVGGYATVAIDLRGHGLSDDPAGVREYTFDKLASDVEGVADDLKLEEPVLAGHCFGGMVSLYVASRKKLQISALILIDTSYRPFILGSERTMPKLVAKLVGGVGYLFPKGKARVHADYARFVGTGDWNMRRLAVDMYATSMRTYLFCCSQVLEFDGKEQLKQIVSPTLVLVGEKDSIFPPIVAERMAREIKKARSEVVAGANHPIVICN